MNIFALIAAQKETHRSAIEYLNLSTLYCIVTANKANLIENQLHLYWWICKICIFQPLTRVVFFRLNYKQQRYDKQSETPAVTFKKDS